MHNTRQDQIDEPHSENFHAMIHIVTIRDSRALDHEIGVHVMCDYYCKTALTEEVKVYEDNFSRLITRFTLSFSSKLLKHNN